MTPQPASAILRDLVAIPTPSSISNLPLLQYVADFLTPLGWHITLQHYVDESGTPKANLIARPSPLPPSAPISLAFVCHTDTVPYSPDWPTALTLTERDGHLHGCGSCDVKGALACFLAAASSITPHPAVALLLTADEEVGCRGMDRLLAAHSLQIQSAIVSEPTSLRPGIAGKGYGLARITVRGREAHSAYPHMGTSAISIAARLITTLEAAFTSETPFAPQDPLFLPPRTTINIGTIHGGSAKNILAGLCTFQVEWRPIPAHSPAAIISQLESLVTAARAANPTAQIDLEILRAEPGFAPAPSGQLQQHLAQLLPTQPTGISFGSEASRLARVAQEVIVIGPGDMTTAHSSRECVPLAELDTWTRTLAQLLS